MQLVDKTVRFVLVITINNWLIELNVHGQQNKNYWYDYRTGRLWACGTADRGIYMINIILL